MELKNECPVCRKPTEKDSEHDAYCENCGFNIVKESEEKQSRATPYEKQ